MKNKKRKLDIMRHSGKKHKEIMKLLKREAKPGITTARLNQIAEEEIDKLAGFKPSFKNYQGFPATICTSINDEMVHGEPSDRKLKIGDILSIDLGLYYKGYHVDAAATFSIGKVNKLKQKLIQSTKGAVKRSISVIKSGVKVNEISKTMQKYIEERGFNVARELTGHGVGKKLHQSPEIPCFDFAKKPGPANPVIKEGQTLAIEAMVAAGSYALTQKGMSFSTQDGSPSCHFEDTVYVRKEGCEILT